MEWVEAIILIISFFLLLGIGVPIAFSIGIASQITILLTIESVPALTTLAQQMATSLDSFTLLAIPFFILAGQFMNQGGIADRLIAFAKSIFGSIPGGLAFVNIISCMLFGAISGSAVAAASAIGGFMSPMMEKEGYDRSFSAAVNISSATTGLIIPPSNILIVYSLASGGVSIGALFLAGYIPGLLMGLSLMVLASIFSIYKQFPRSERTTMSNVIKSFLSALPSLFMLILVIGGIVAGLFTATEASAISVIYAMVLSFFYKEISIGDLSDIFIETIKISSIVLFLIATSMSMSWVMSYEDLPSLINEIILGFSDNPIIIILIINTILLLVGIFMDMTPAVLIFTPIFLPIVTATGMDPLHFGIMMIMNLCIGLCTPPVGSVLFVGCSISNLKIEDVIKPLIPFFLVLIIVLLAVTFIPNLSLWLPKYLGL
ncbi:TRAP transporter large permease [Bacteroidota bacterium]|jgi:tripartite ATP-independent transporter DctM subunit|nr:TRAP transporter large permease [Bacteroidota bacterium]MDC3296397.1 TRAP transporter large permease [Balneolaceae bacterium]